VVQEALSNARKHANAHTLEVDLRFESASVECIVRDDGNGFDPGEVQALSGTSHWGLSSMGERMLMIGGELEVESILGQGTEVRARVPLDTVGEGADERAR
jgi:two-component system nitrate/nitrite sensor histidine kinase NarX